MPNRRTDSLGVGNQRNKAGAEPRTLEDRTASRDEANRRRQSLAERMRSRVAGQDAQSDDPGAHSAGD